MTLMTAVLVANLLCGAQGDSPKRGQAVPTTIGVYQQNYQRGDDPKEYEFIPLAAFENGKWLPEEFFSTMIPGEDFVNAKDLRPEQRAFLKLLVNETFYSFSDPKTTFRPTKETEAFIIDDLVLGLEGVFTGNLSDAGEDPEIPMANVSSVIGKMKPGELSKENNVLVEKRARKGLSRLVVEQEAEMVKDKRRPAFDPDLYQAPVLNTVVKCSLSSGWQALWIHATLIYPLEKSPTPCCETLEKSPWSGYYYAILDPQSPAERRILWEYWSIPGFTSTNYMYSLLGICDADGNGKPEFLLSEGGYEEGAYRLKHFKGGKFVDISSVSGAL